VFLFRSLGKTSQKPRNPPNIPVAFFTKAIDSEGGNIVLHGMNLIRKKVFDK
jgi:hypothetical protein